MKKIYAMLAAMAAIMFLGNNAQAQQFNPDYYLGQKGWVCVEEIGPWYNVDKFTYDEQGRLIKDEYYEEGVFQNTIEYYYGPNSQSYSLYDTVNQVLETGYYEYDDNNNLRYYVRKTGDGILIYDMKLEFIGNISVKVDTWYDETGVVRKISKNYYEYEYRNADGYSQISYKNVGTDSDPVLVKNAKYTCLYEFGELAREITYKFSETEQDWVLSDSYEFVATRNSDGYVVELAYKDKNGNASLVYTVSYAIDGKDIIATITDSVGQVYTVRYSKLSDLSGINNIIMQQTDDRMFNIQGQRVGADHRGITIMNGKKMLLRR